MTRLVLDEIVDPFGAKVSVIRERDGRVREARFDLTGLPRVDGLLAGRPAAEVPQLVERLCGICPAAHHLAGVRALEALAGLRKLPPTAVAIRRLLHYGSALETHAPRLLSRDREGALALRRFGKAAMAAAGSPGHFPTTAVPGGVRASTSGERVDALATTVASVLEVALRAAERELEAQRPGPAATDTATALPSDASAYTGADLALVDDSGRPDLLGTRLLAVAADGSVAATASPAEWDATVAEQFPGATAPRPYLVRLGPERGRYRVGPTAQLRTGVVSTPLAAELQRSWLAGAGAAASARAIITVHAVEAIASLLDDAALVAGDTMAEVGECRPDAVGVGWVDGPRGLLVHRYATTADGRLAAAQILTPTAQNEPWLAELLTAAAAADTERELEAAIREADPCLPCSSAPDGAMGLQVEETTGGA